MPILPWLLDAGLDLSAQSLGNTPLIAQVIDFAAPEVIRAMIAAGADPVDPGGSYASPRQHARYAGRHDLDFLPRGEDDD